MLTWKMTDPDQPAFSDEQKWLTGFDPEGEIVHFQEMRRLPCGCCSDWESDWLHLSDLDAEDQAIIRAAVRLREG